MYQLQFLSCNVDYGVNYKGVLPLHIIRAIIGRIIQKSFV